MKKLLFVFIMLLMSVSVSCYAYDKNDFIEAEKIILSEYTKSVNEKSLIDKNLSFKDGSNIVLSDAVVAAFRDSSKFLNEHNGISKIKKFEYDYNGSNRDSYIKELLKGNQFSLFKYEIYTKDEKYLLLLDLYCGIENDTLNLYLSTYQPVDLVALEYADAQMNFKVNQILENNFELFTKDFTAELNKNYTQAKFNRLKLQPITKIKRINYRNGKSIRTDKSNNALYVTYKLYFGNEKNYVSEIGVEKIDGKYQINKFFVVTLPDEVKLEQDNLVEKALHSLLNNEKDLFFSCFSADAAQKADDFSFYELSESLANRKYINKERSYTFIITSKQVPKSKESIIGKKRMQLIELPVPEVYYLYELNFSDLRWNLTVTFDDTLENIKITSFNLKVQ